jgi:hypothetical protein
MLDKIKVYLALIVVYLFGWHKDDDMFDDL